jgi:hypothetical protein
VENSWWKQPWTRLGIIVAAVIVAACGVAALVGRGHDDERSPTGPTEPGLPSVPVATTSSGNGVVVPG